MDLELICEALTANTTLTNVLKFQKYVGSITLNIKPDTFEIGTVQFVPQEIKIDKTKMKSGEKKRWIKKTNVLH